MAIRKLRTKSGAVYFATFTCFQWLPLFEMVNGYDLVYNWMHHAQGTSKNLAPALSVRRTADRPFGQAFSFGHPSFLHSQLPTGNFLSSRPCLTGRQVG